MLDHVVTWFQQYRVKRWLPSACFVVTVQNSRWWGNRNVPVQRVNKSTSLQEWKSPSDKIRIKMNDHLQIYPQNWSEQWTKQSAFYFEVLKHLLQTTIWNIFLNFDIWRFHWKLYSNVDFVILIYEYNKAWVTKGHKRNSPGRPIRPTTLQILLKFVMWCIKISRAILFSATLVQNKFQFA